MSQLIAESSASWLVRSSPTPLPNFRIAGKPIGIYPPKRWAHCRRSTMLTPEYSLVNQSRTTAYLAWYAAAKRSATASWWLSTLFKLRRPLKKRSGIAASSKYSTRRFVVSAETRLNMSTKVWFW